MSSKLADASSNFPNPEAANFAGGSGSSSGHRFRREHGSTYGRRLLAGELEENDSSTTNRKGD